VRIAEMLAFQSYNTKSPLNGEAAKWVEQNVGALPLDPACMTLDEAPTGAPQAATAPGVPISVPAPPPPVAAAAARTIEVSCPACAAMLRVRIAESAIRVRCPKCRNLATVGTDGTLSP